MKYFFFVLFFLVASLNALTEATGLDTIDAMHAVQQPKGQLRVYF
jgi:hypothetical protein